MSLAANLKTKMMGANEEGQMDEYGDED